MGINGRFGRPSTIVVPGGSSSVGARNVGAGSVNPLAELQKYARQVNIDRSNKELLRKAGVKSDIYDNADSATLSAMATKVGGYNVDQIETNRINTQSGKDFQTDVENTRDVADQQFQGIDEGGVDEQTAAWRNLVEGLQGSGQAEPEEDFIGERPHSLSPITVNAQRDLERPPNAFGDDSLNHAQGFQSQVANTFDNAPEALGRFLQTGRFKEGLKQAEARDAAEIAKDKSIFDSLMSDSVKNQVINMQDEEGSGIIGMINKQTGETIRAFEDTLKGRKTVKIPLTVRKNINVDNQKSARNALTTKMAKDVANDLGLKLRYTKLFQRYDPNQFLTVNRLRLKLQKAFDGTFNFIGLPKDEKFNSTEDQIAFSNAVSFINEAKEIFIEHRILATGGAFTEQEMEQLKTVYLDVDGQGPEAFIATVRGKMNRLSESINANEQFFSKLDNDVSISELIRYQSDYIDNLLLTGDIFNAGLPIVNKRKENLKKLDTYKLPGDKN